MTNVFLKGSNSFLAILLSFILVLFIVSCNNDLVDNSDIPESNSELHPLLNEGLIARGYDPTGFVLDEETLILTNGKEEVNSVDLLSYLGEQELKKSKPEKASTGRPNNTMPGGQAPLRCVGCTVSGGTNNCTSEESYKINVYYNFSSNYPSAYRQEFKDALALYTTILSGKIVFIETSNNPQMIVQTTTSVSSANLPSIGGKLGSAMSIHSGYFNAANNRIRRNEILHEIGHAVGLKHAHAGDSSGARYSTGLGVVKMNSIMSYDYYVTTNTDHLTLGTLPQIDINVLTDLYPYGGGTNSCDNRTVTPQPITYLPQALSDISGVWTLMDVNQDGSVSGLDKTLIIKHILGIELLPTDIATRAGWIDGSNPSLSSIDIVHVTNEILGTPLSSYPTQNHLRILYDFNNNGSFDYSGEINEIYNQFTPTEQIWLTNGTQNFEYTDWKSNTTLARFYKLSSRELVDYVPEYENLGPNQFSVGITSAMFRDLAKIQVVYGNNF
jgi:hypothetical protein